MTRRKRGIRQIGGTLQAPRSYSKETLWAATSSAKVLEITRPWRGRAKCESRQRPSQGHDVGLTNKKFVAFLTLSGSHISLVASRGHHAPVNVFLLALSMAHYEDDVTYASFDIDDRNSSAALLEHDNHLNGHSALNRGLTYKRTERRAWSFFITACLISLITSAFNFTRLSLSVSFPQQHSTPTSLKTPSVYLGLERVPVDASYCRSRGTFPKEFSVVRDDDVMTRQRIHAPDDKIQFAFGGNVSNQL